MYQKGFKILFGELILMKNASKPGLYVGMN